MNYPTKVLQFGGGKDSLACLYLLRSEWDNLTVAWLNTGTAFPETLELMERIKKLVPHFLEVRTDVMADIASQGWPSDVVPVVDTYWGRLGTESTGIMVRSWTECCARNFWIPLNAKMKEIGAKIIVRGQRNSEVYKSTIRNGHTGDGITYEFPLQDWTEEQVFQFLRDNDVEIPSYYAYTKSSLDCWNCTAYLDAKDSQIEYMRDVHPDKHAVVTDKLRQIRMKISGPLANIDRCVA